MATSLTTANLNEIKSNLRNGIVEFSYIKKNGEERTAKGTLNNDLIAKAGYVPSENKASAKKELASNMLCYFDIDKNAWRIATASKVA